jgi:Transcriptional regulator
VYLPKHFAETRLDVLHGFIRSRAFGTLVTMTTRGIEANHIPFVLKSDPAPFGTLEGHLARANSQWRDSIPHVEALVIFEGPDAYIAPSWYPTKRETGKAVPTWNYIVVHARGKLRVIEDESWLRSHVEELTHQHERGRGEPWAVSDAPPGYIEQLLRGTVGIQIELTRLEGKWKLGQNRSEADRRGVLEGLRAEPGLSSQWMAECMARHLEGLDS